MHDHLESVIRPWADAIATVERDAEVDLHVELMISGFLPSCAVTAQANRRSAGAGVRFHTSESPPTLPSVPEQARPDTAANPR